MQGGSGGTAAGGTAQGGAPGDAGNGGSLAQGGSDIPDASVPPGDGGCVPGPLYRDRDGDGYGSEAQGDVEFQRAVDERPQGSCPGGSNMPVRVRFPAVPWLCWPLLACSFLLEASVMTSFMFRSRWALSAVLALAIGSACSDDDSGDGASGNAGSSAGDGGSGAGGGDGGSAGTTMANAGSGGDEAMYSAAEACDLFAEVTCAKGAECGLVIPQPVRSCLTCNALVLGIIASECENDLGGPRNAADVDRCVDSIADNSCEETCSNAPFDGCEAFAELPTGGGVGVECDEQCL